MRKSKNLLVYRYEFWDEKRKLMRESDTYATLDAILRGVGIPLLYTAKVVPHVALFHELVVELPYNR
jgi:hypothetical protein